jgi:spore maturation protein CgeB
MSRPLRILVPNHPAPDSFTDNVVHTLRSMGHEVCAMPRLALRDQGPLYRILTDAWTAYRPATLSSQERWTLATVRDWKPHLVLALTLALREEVLLRLRQLGTGLCVAWWGDPPGNMRGMGLLADGWDRIYIKDAAAVDKLRAVGLPADLLNEAANPEWHRPVRSATHPDAQALVVAGNYYGYRQFLVRRLAEAGVPLALYGTRPPRWSHPAIVRQFRGRYIVREEKSRVFHAGLACLNSTHLSEGNSLNCRAFEICAAGGLQLIEAKPAVADCYDPGTEVLTYASVDEILSHLDRARREPDWSRAIREAGHRRTLAEHTYRHRLDRILSDADLVRRAA